MPGKASGSQILEMVKDHPVFRDSFWSNFRQGTGGIAFEGLAGVFHQFDQVTLASRNLGRLPKTLREHGLVEQAALVEQVLRSEDGHQEELWKMLEFLLQRAFPTETAELIGGKNTGKDFGNMLTERRTLLPGSRSMIELFRARDLEGYDNALFSLGVMVGVEFFANRSFMPGFATFCVGNPTFGHPTMETEELFYLKEHCGESGAEAEHEAKMTQAMLNGLFREEDLAQVALGAKKLCDTAQDWYRDMSSCFSL